MPLPIRDPFKCKLTERLEHPHVPSARLHSLPDCYKIKLCSVGHRLVHQVNDSVVVVTLIALGRRGHAGVYRTAARRARP